MLSLGGLHVERACSAANIWLIWSLGFNIQRYLGDQQEEASTTQVSLAPHPPKCWARNTKLRKPELNGMNNIQQPLGR